MSNIPKTVQIGPVKYIVKEVKGLANPQGINCYGRHKYDDRTIEIDKEIDPKVKNVILFHEVLHGLMCCQEVDLDYEKEEHVVKNLTHGLVKFMQDNPEYIKTLMKG